MMTNAQRVAYLEEKQMFQDWIFFLGQHLGNDKTKLLINSFLDWRPNMRNKFSFSLGITEPVVIKPRFCRRTCLRYHRGNNVEATTILHCKLGNHCNEEILNVPSVFVDDMSQAAYELSPDQERHEIEEEKSRMRLARLKEENENKSSSKNEIAEALREKFVIVNNSVVKILKEKIHKEIQLRIQLLLSKDKLNARDEALKAASEKTLNSITQIVELESYVAKLELNKCELGNELTELKRKIPDIKQFVQSYVLSTGNRIDEEYKLRVQIEDKVKKLESEKVEMNDMIQRLTDLIINIENSLLIYKNAAENMLDMDYANNLNQISQVDVLKESSDAGKSTCDGQVDGTRKNVLTTNENTEIGDPISYQVDTCQTAVRNNKIELCEATKVIKLLKQKVDDINSSLASKTVEMQLYQLATENLLTNICERPSTPKRDNDQERDKELTNSNMTIEKTQSIEIGVGTDTMVPGSTHSEQQTIDETSDQYHCEVDKNLFESNEDIKSSLQYDVNKLQYSLDCKIEELTLYQMAAENILKSTDEEIRAEKDEKRSRIQQIQEQEVRIAALTGEVIQERKKLKERETELKLYRCTAELLLDTTFMSVHPLSEDSTLITEEGVKNENENIMADTKMRKKSSEDDHKRKVRVKAKSKSVQNIRKSQVRMIIKGR